MGKTEVRIEVDAELLAQAQASGMGLHDIAAVVEQELRAALSARGVSETAGAAYASATRALSEADKARRWALENAEAIKAQRERIDEIGVFGEDLRSW